MDMLQNLKSGSGSSSEKVSYSLNEVLGILHMFTVEKLSPKQVAEVTGRTVHTLRYKFLEGEINLNGKKQIRSMKRFNSVEEIFTYYKTEWIDQADVSNRINDYKTSLIEKNKVA